MILLVPKRAMIASMAGLETIGCMVVAERINITLVVLLAAIPLSLTSQTFWTKSFFGVLITDRSLRPEQAIRSC